MKRAANLRSCAKRSGRTSGCDGRIVQGGATLRLTEDVYLVGGSPSVGFGLSGEIDSHVYCIDGGGELALIDCGMAVGDSLERIFANLREDGLDPARIGSLFVTHYHTDHAGGAANFR